MSTFIEPHVYSLQMQAAPEPSDVAAEARHNRVIDAAILGDPQLLAVELEAAKVAHTKYEAEHGPDPDWPLWYAEWLLGAR